MAVRILIFGVVQGVGYRAWMEGQARLLNVRGWVRNLNDGTVEAVLEGEPSTIDSLIQVCHEGPRFADVQRIDVERQDDQHLLGFEIRGIEG